MAKKRTYKGKVVDMDEIIQNNQNAPAVGNANMNARGDVIDDKGRVTQSREDRAREYNRNVSNSVVKSSLLDEVDDLPDLQKAKKNTNTKTTQTQKKTTKQSGPSKSFVDEDFDAPHEDTSETTTDSSTSTDKEDGDK